MIRFALILSLMAGSLMAAAASAQTTPLPRPDGLVERSAERAAEAEAEGAVEDVPQVSDDTQRAEIAAQITGAIRACWNVADLSEEAAVVRIRVAFNTMPEGEVIRESIEMTSFQNGTQDAAEEALGPAFAAIMRCGNDGLDLPPETHAIWRRVEVIFDASSQVTR